MDLHYYEIIRISQPDEHDFYLYNFYLDRYVYNIAVSREFHSRIINNILI